MAPNLLICLRTIFCPLYWFSRGERINGSIQREEHWDSPVPGIYKYIPSRGWHLVYRDGNDDDEEVPVPLIYCRILHRYMFEDEMKDRCRWYKARLQHDAAPVERLFFCLDDGFTWVAGWDEHGVFIPGPYQKWVLEKETKTMHPVLLPDSANVSRCSIVPRKLE